MIKLTKDVRIAARNLRRNTKRTLIAVFTVAGGVVAFLLAGGFITWIFHDMREATIHSQLGHLQIVRPGYLDQGIADPYSHLLDDGSVEHESIRVTSGVFSLAPRLALSGLISLGDATIAFTGEGIDPVLERSISNRVTIMAGDNLVDASQRAVLLGEGLARSLGAKPGDRVVLLATAGNGTTSAVEVAVAGTFSTISKDFDDQALRLPIAVARKLRRVSGSTSWVAILHRTEDTAGVVAELSRLLSARDYEVIPWTALADFYNKTVTLFSRQVAVVKFIIGLIIVLTISNTQTMSVLERTTEIGTGLAIGLRRSAVMRMFLAEGMLIGILGGLFGVALGYALAELISAIGIPMPPPPGMAHGYIGKILLTSDLMVDALILALVTTLLASLMPAWRASRMNIVDALRCNQ
jgi:putative ABC transport system permease protein